MEEHIYKESKVNTINCTKKRLPKLHKDLLLISIKYYKQIKKAYFEVLGLNAIDHLSINLVNPDGEMVFLSSTPYTGINVCSSELWLHDSSIHPNTYENKDFYWWDDCYSVQMKSVLKLEKEIKNNLNYGFILTKKIENFYLLYSFATKEKDIYIKKMFEEYKNTFIDMGDYCYSEIRSIYEQYSGNYNPPKIELITFPKNGAEYSK